MIGARTRNLRQIMMVAMTAAAGLLLCGCHTIEGIGHDISSAGQGLADVAADINPDNN